VVPSTKLSSARAAHFNLPISFRCYNGSGENFVNPDAKEPIMKRWIWIVLMLIALLAVAMTAISCGGDDDDDEEDDIEESPFVDDDDALDTDYVVEPVQNDAPPWPEWPLRHWVWEDESTQDSAQDLVFDYIANDIPVGAIIIDSPWATGYNTFIWDQDKFPDAQAMIDGFHDADVRVFMWTTPNVNVDSPNFQEGLDNGYYVNHGRTYDWWKGPGAFIDFNNPDALAWWHDQVDLVLDMGIDGWKTDGSAFYLWASLMVETYTGTISPHEYQALYYRDFFYYTRERLGDDRVISARPVDSYGFPLWGPTFAPHDVNFASWVGDQDPSWSGLRAALANLFLSADRNYVNFGSDIGGYRGDEIRDKELFIRWAQLGALCPIMENGGSGEHRPWMYDTETLDIYRDFVELHHQLIPYLYSQGARSYEQGIPLMRPFGDAGRNYQLGDFLYVSAIITPTREKTIRFPSGTWIDYWDGTQYTGEATATIAYPLDRYPLFIKKGALLPLANVDTDLFGDLPEGSSPLVVSVYPNPGTNVSFDLYQEKTTGARIEALYADSIRLTVSATERPIAFLVFNVEQRPVSVTDSFDAVIPDAIDLANLPTAESGWVYDMDAQTLWIKPGSASKGLSFSVN
jgi:alpha-glucosidase (family GH31 glycosyl hydrolase)